MQAGDKLGLAVFTVAFSASIYAMQPASTNEGSSTASPIDVARTPSPGGPVPIPYPNIGQPTGDSGQKQKIDGATATMKNQSTFKHSTGDEAGTRSSQGLRTTVMPSMPRQTPKTDFGTVLRQGSLPAPTPVIQTQPAQRAPILQSAPLMRR